MVNTESIFRPASVIPDRVKTVSDEAKKIDAQIYAYGVGLGMTEDIAKLFAAIAAVNTNNYSNDMFVKDENPYGVIWLGTNGTKGTAVPGRSGSYFVRLNDLKSAMERAWSFVKTGLKDGGIDDPEKVYRMFSTDTNSVAAYMQLAKERFVSNDWLVWAGIVIAAVVISRKIKR